MRFDDSCTAKLQGLKDGERGADGSSPGLLLRMPKPQHQRLSAQSGELYLCKYSSHIPAEGVQDACQNLN